MGLLKFLFGPKSMDGLVRSSMKAVQSGRVQPLRLDRAVFRLGGLWQFEPELSEATVQAIALSAQEDEHLGAMCDTAGPERERWTIGMSDDFLSSIASADKAMKGRVLDALATLSDEPLKARGDTVKPLTGEAKGLWRYRIGDFRLIYHPDRKTHQVSLLAFGPRQGMYD